VYQKWRDLKINSTNLDGFFSSLGLAASLTI